jgi:hypothetical protein
MCQYFVDSAIAINLPRAAPGQGLIGLEAVEVHEQRCILGFVIKPTILG